ncbi:bifunctional folylpolyglutamate synthase/dihydrofolate synthase [Polaribacter pacificus]|uniref:bifunctional folylpolyglutamate synthase/dihydrofolate synthase n=1 Tax=Polaribacter pacificus TaxID=1775173 RepID=UPI001663EA36|nr:folylpolyglutamate synthase/dihydrofolate synthase family protein [Polaribacter pacificus]
MTYQEALDWMFAQLPMFQRQGAVAFKKDLSITLALSIELGFPERQFKSIHVGGTNGKGSASHMIASVLQEAGYKVGLYTSPHLKSFTERIKINGTEISEEKVLNFIQKNKTFLEQQGLSFFEMTVGMAFHFFAQEAVDVAVIEVGLGGRLDSTNIIRPEVSVITNIGLDHTQFLGESLVEIAGEKAGIIKKDVPVVIGERQTEVEAVFLEKAQSMQSPIHFASDNPTEYATDLLGEYQKKNSKTAVAAIKQLSGFLVTDNHIAKGLLKVVENTKLLGRWQVLQGSPKVVCDTAHNKDGLQLTLQQLAKEPYAVLHIVLGVVSDKKLNEVLPLFPKNARYYFCKPNIPRGMSANELQKEAQNYHLEGAVFESVKTAYSEALSMAKPDDFIYVGGSTFVVAEVL